MKEVHQDIGQQFEIISAGFLYAQEGVDRRISGGARKILVLPVGDVEVVAALTDAHQEAVRFDVAVNKVSRVDIFNARNLIAIGMRREEK
jgi:hypothetical protein